MSEVSVTIYNHTYRLAVSTGEENLLKDCAKLVDEQMSAVRSAGKVIAADQIAVLSALEIAYDAKKKAAQAADGAQASAAATATAPEAQAAPAPSPTTSAEPAASHDDQEVLTEIRELCRLCEEALYKDAAIGSLF